MRANPATAGLPVLIATSRTLSSEERDAMGVPAAAVMSKYDLNEQLLAAVAGAIAPAPLAQPQ